MCVCVYVCMFVCVCVGVCVCVHACRCVYETLSIYIFICLPDCLAACIPDSIKLIDSILPAVLLCLKNYSQSFAQKLLSMSRSTLPTETSPC